MTEPDRPQWRKSSYSADQKECVEVQLDPEGIGVRDTKNREGGEIRLSPAAWKAFLDSVIENRDKR